jgi:hypothetical protein
MRPMHTQFPCNARSHLRGSAEQGLVTSPKADPDHDGPVAAAGHTDHRLAVCVAMISIRTESAAGRKWVIADLGHSPIRCRRPVAPGACGVALFSLGHPDAHGAGRTRVTGPESAERTDRSVREQRSYCVATPTAAPSCPVNAIPGRGEHRRRGRRANPR